MSQTFAAATSHSRFLQRACPNSFPICTTASNASALSKSRRYSWNFSPGKDNEFCTRNASYDGGKRMQLVGQRKCPHEPMPAGPDVKWNPKPPVTFARLAKRIRRGILSVRLTPTVISTILFRKPCPETSLCFECYLPCRAVGGVLHF